MIFLNAFLKSVIDYLFFKKKVFFIIYNNRKFTSWNLFRLKKDFKGINIVLRNTKNHFEYEKEDINCYKPVGVNNFWSIEYNIQYKSNGNRNKTLSVEEYIYKIRPYLKDIINDVTKSDNNSINNNDYFYYF